jgi:hypothetical protein
MAAFLIELCTPVENKNDGYKPGPDGEFFTGNRRAGLQAGNS